MMIAGVFLALIACVAATSDPYAYHNSPSYSPSYHSPSYHSPSYHSPDYTQYYYSVPVYDNYGGHAQIYVNRYPGGVNYNLNEYGPGYTHYQNFEQKVAGYHH